MGHGGKAPSPNHGIRIDLACSIDDCQLRAGDTLALFTDGVTESFNAAGEEFGEAWLIEALRRHRELASRDLISAVVDELQRFSACEQYDDITLIVAKCIEPQQAKFF